MFKPHFVITRVPRPVPREISSIVDVREILEVNEDYKTMTVSHTLTE